MNLEDLSKFLNEANKSTYANKDAPKAPSARLGSEDYHFEQGNLTYHDTYFGGRDFIGEEIVYQDGKPVWGANYFGVILDETVNEKDVYAFLRQALMQEYTDVIPVRGPAKFSDGEWTYQFNANGGLASFSGQEEIVLRGKNIYRCLIHGGLIQ